MTPYFHYAVKLADPLKMLVKCDITIPEKIVKALGFKESELGSALTMELAVHYFQKNLLSFGQARELANLSVWDFLELLKDRRVPLHYDVSEYEEDKKTIEELV